MTSTSSSPRLVLAAARGELLRSSPAYNNWSPDPRDWSPQRQRDWLRWQP
ncbi:MAG: hypothetical protein WKF73_18930 [Nocardioidaceae bacterium]